MKQISVQTSMGWSCMSQGQSPGKVRWYCRVQDVSFLGRWRYWYFIMGKMRSPYREAIIVFFTIMSILIAVSSERERSFRFNDSSIDSIFFLFQLSFCYLAIMVRFIFSQSRKKFQNFDVCCIFMYKQSWKSMM